jgi:hypothetical protein
MPNSGTTDQATGTANESFDILSVEIRTRWLHDPHDHVPPVYISHTGNVM